VRIFKNTQFARFARKAGISDDDLKAIVPELENGQWEACYGGDVYKKRIARPGEGKSGGYRAIIIFRSEKMTYYTFGFSKSDLDDISEKEERRLKAHASTMLNLTEAQLQARLDEGALLEIL
jgi:hypothetical protein